MEPKADGSSKRERKRQTDRLAQREHRKRQRQYIEKLEDQLNVLQSRDQSEVVRLGTLNFRLKAELDQMYALWDEMEGLFQRQKALRRESALTEEKNLSSLNRKKTLPKDGSTDLQSAQQESPHDPGLGEAQQASADNSEAHKIWDAPMSIHFEEPRSAAPATDHYAFCDPGELATLRSDANVQQESAAMTGITPQSADLILPQEPQKNTAGANESATQRFQDNERRESASTQPDHPAICSPPASGSSLGLDTSRPEAGDAHTSSFSPSSFFHWPYEVDSLPIDSHLMHSPSMPFPPVITEADDHRDTSQDHEEANQAGSGLHLDLQSFDLWLLQYSSRFSLFPRPPLYRSPADEQIYSIISRASSGSKPPDPPSLMDFLIDNPANSLSVDLKAFLAPVKRAKRTAEYLATYWVLYLLLRWYTLRDEASYSSLPAWLRPTSLQLAVEHPIAADVIAWPEIREGLICMGQSDAQEIRKVAEEIGNHLTVDIDTTSLTYDNAHEDISTQVKDIRRWKLSKAFFDAYPQWRGLSINKPVS